MPPADYFDPERRPPAVADEHVERLVAYSEGGLDRNQARFAASVMHLGGVFTSKQAARWLDVHARGWDAGEGDAASRRRSGRLRFLQDLFREYGARRRPSRLAVKHELAGGAPFGHFGSKPAYAAVGLENSRYRRFPPLPAAMQRLLVHDYILETGDRWTWYGATPQKLALFDALGVSRDVLPGRDYAPRSAAAAAGGRVTRRWFVDHVPVGMAGWKLCFPFVLSEEGTVASAVARLRPYKRLWAVLRALGLWVQVVIVGRSGDTGDWERRVARYVTPPTGADRARAADAVERYLLARFAADGVEPVLRAYGGSPGARARLRELDQALGRAPAQGGAMAVEVWLSERLSAPGWRSGPAVAGAGGRGG